VEQNYSFNEFETAIEFNPTMNELGNLLAQAANEPQNRAPGADALGATAGNINSDNTQRHVMYPMVILTQMIYKMRTQREVDQHRYEADQRCHEADQCCHEEWMQFEEDKCCEEARQRKQELQALSDILATRVATKQSSLPRSGAMVPMFNLDKDKSSVYTWQTKQHSI
jgi:hypothetical protein